MTDYFRKFIHSEQAGGFLLLIFTLIALTLANSEYAGYFNRIWNIEAGFIGDDYLFQKTIRHWIDDGLMAVFFLLMGLEIKREVISGELSTVRKALLPGIAALGGMIVPAAIYMAFNIGTVSESGWGIPMATDIAFSLAVLSLIKGVPKSLRMFLITLAVVDDIGAIIIIAVFYSDSIQIIYLGASSVIVLLLFILNKQNVLKLSYYIILGIVLWLLVLKSGIHATIAGVVLAFTIPYNKDTNESPLHKLITVLHTPVNFIVLPLFALANTGIVIQSDFFGSLKTTDSLGILFGLVLGKPIGIISFVYLSAKLKLINISAQTGFLELLGVGFLCGIGYTMSIFISGLAFDDNFLIESSKISVLVASLIAAIIGLTILYPVYSNKRNKFGIRQ